MLHQYLSAVSNYFHYITIIIITIIITITTTLSTSTSLLLAISCYGSSCSITIQVVQPPYYTNSESWNGALNLAEVELWYAGTKVPNSAISATLSTTLGGSPVSNCFDGNYDNFCHTNDGQCCGSLTMTVSNVLFDTIKVYNRKLCCNGRMRGGTISVSYASSTIWRGSFPGPEMVYIFNMQSKSRYY